MDDVLALDHYEYLIFFLSLIRLRYVWPVCSVCVLVVGSNNNPNCLCSTLCTTDPDTRHCDEINNRAVHLTAYHHRPRTCLSSHRSEHHNQLSKTSANNQLSPALLLDNTFLISDKTIQSSLFCRFWASWWWWASLARGLSTPLESSARLCKLSSAAVAVASMTWEPVRPELRKSARLVKFCLLKTKNTDHFSSRQPTVSSVALCMTTSVKIFPHRSARQEFKVENIWFFIFKIVCQICCSLLTLPSDNLQKQMQIW